MNMWRTIYVVVIFLVIFLTFIFFRDYIFLFFGNLKVAVSETLNKQEIYKSILECKLKNNFSLASSTDFIEKKSSFFVENGLNYRRLKVFSSYPFNNYSEIILEGGKDVGLKENMPVLVAKGILLGRISKVKEKTSLVETIFNPNWKSSVFIGNKNVKGLLEGGTSPIVNFVLKESKVDLNSIIYNADSRFPLGLEIGKIFAENENSNWKNFSVSLSYDLNFVYEVLVITNFE